MLYKTGKGMDNLISAPDWFSITQIGKHADIVKQRICNMLNRTMQCSVYISVINQLLQILKRINDAVK
jgi:hypothetical protein